MTTRLKTLQEKLGVKFKDPSLLAQSMVHRSYLNEVRQKELKSNERMEFLGDAILEFVISEWLFVEFPQYPEGTICPVFALSGR